MSAQNGLTCYPLVGLPIDIDDDLNLVEELNHRTFFLDPDNNKQIKIMRFPNYLHRAVETIVSQVERRRGSQSKSMNAVYNLCIEDSITFFYGDPDTVAFMDNKEQFNKESKDAKDCVASDCMAEFLSKFPIDVGNDSSKAHMVSIHIPSELYNQVSHLVATLTIFTYNVALLCITRTISRQPDGVVHPEHREKARETFASYRRRMLFMRRFSELALEFSRE
ncbi:MAG: hypothetical protein ACJ76Y_27275 [Thermoanaerobaculia bacterium]